MAGLDEEVLEDELEMLEAILPGACRFSSVASGEKGKGEVVASCVPLTGDDDAIQFVRCDLTLRLPATYPEAAPNVSVGASRGLEESQRSALVEAVEAVASLIQAHVVQLRPLRVGLRGHHTSAIGLRAVRSDIRDFAAVV